MTFEIFPRWPLKILSTDTIVRNTHTIRIASDLAAGKYGIAVRLVDSESGAPVGQEADLGAVAVGRAKEGRAVFPIDRSVHSSYGVQLELLRYGVADESDQIRVLLHWRAVGRLEEDYKFFVHLS